MENGTVPRVIGMGARDAIYLLEKEGMRVNISGSGKVISQSIQAGSTQAKGKTISITLR